MIEEELTALYKKTKKQLAALMDDVTFSNFFRALQSGKRAFSVKNTQIKKSIDEDWVNAIKEAVPALDVIVNNPRRFMKRETDVVPVEKARVVDSESVRHLASHTNLIHSVGKSGEVRPNKILTAFNDESIELYENRFVMTLIIRVCQFIDRRYYLLGTGGNEFSSTLGVEGGFEQAGETSEYSVNMTVHQGADYFDGGISAKVYEDLFLIRKYFNSFRYSPFMKAMTGAAQVRPPVMNTNLLTKEPNYSACVKLWDFIESYDKVGYKIEIIDRAPELARDFAEDFDAVDLLLYLALKNKMGGYDGRRRNMAQCSKKVVKPTMKDIEETENDPRRFEVPVGLRAMTGGETARRETERAVKDILLRALRKEQARRELEEAARDEREKRLEDIVRNALTSQKERREEARREREASMQEAIREALAAEARRDRAEATARHKQERRAVSLLERDLERSRLDEQSRLEEEREEKREGDRLMRALLGDLLRIEDEREYERSSPLVLGGREYMPVPVPQASEERLPASAESVAQLKEFEKAFEPPLTLSDEDWAELEEAKRDGRRPRRRIGQEKLFDAIEEALSAERVKRRREADRKRRARAKADAEQQARQEVAAAAGAGEELPLSDEEILDVLENAERLRDASADRDVGPADGTREPDRTSGPGGHGGRGGEPEEHAGSGSVAPTDEVEKGFWRRLFEILFLWWRK